MSGSDDKEAAALIFTLLSRRAADATLCPSEVARALTRNGDDHEWREAMPTGHAAVDRLLRAGSVRLSWKGAPLEIRFGAYRVALERGRHGGN